MGFGRGERSRLAAKGSKTATASGLRQEAAVVTDPESGRMETRRADSPSKVPHGNDGLPSWLPSASAANAYLIGRERARESQRNATLTGDPLQLLRVNDVCRLLRISKPTFWRMRRRSDFPRAAEVTDHVFAWRRRDVEAWLDRRYRPDAADVRTTTEQPLSPRSDAPSIRRASDPRSFRPRAQPRRDASRPRQRDPQLVLPLPI